MQVTITAINRKERVSAKTNRPFESVSIKCEEKGDKWISGFGRADNKSWKVGDKVDINIVEKGEYLNFEQGRAAVQGFDMEARDRLLRIEIAVTQILGLLKKPTKDDFDEEPPF